MSFFEELKRRNVIRVAIAYSVGAWFVLQLSDVVLENINAPDWVMQAVMLALAIGLPVVVLLAWAFEMTPEGIKKEKDVDRSQSITAVTGRKLDRMIIGILTVTVGYLLIDKLVLQDTTPAPQETTQSEPEEAVSIEDTGPSVDRRDPGACLECDRRLRLSGHPVRARVLHGELRAGDARVLLRHSFLGDRRLGHCGLVRVCGLHRSALAQVLVGMGLRHLHRRDGGEQHPQLSPVQRARDHGCGWVCLLDLHLDHRLRAVLLRPSDVQEGCSELNPLQ
mgnify:CR=1 FL=1